MRMKMMMWVIRGVQTWHGMAHHGWITAWNVGGRESRIGRHHRPGWIRDRRWHGVVGRPQRGEGWWMTSLGGGRWSPKCVVQKRVVRDTEKGTNHFLGAFFHWNILELISSRGNLCQTSQDTHQDVDFEGWEFIAIAPSTESFGDVDCRGLLLVPLCRDIRVGRDEARHGLLLVVLVTLIFLEEIGFEGKED